ncbi:arylamine N-acetyltransferase family protein [Sphaerisporangium perillae]|uniref:arylamine N-acetyltransferase family protein n=1 Tax=Sphaerisporangium perillae TaxID=2935860 RepID=UPI002010C4AC|nr:arylamine N-acetyltransferase [Sphaerisporangium perillae]
MTRSLDVSAYLRRLGLDGLAGPPSVESLARLHAAHVERVPYEYFHIWLDQPTSVEPLESAGRILRRRGGYCFHLNGAFSLLLANLGYQVTRHVGGVQGSASGPAGATGNHLALTVSGLPSARCPAGVWFVDLGLGDALHEPLPLVEGTYRQGPFEYRLRPSEAEPGGWRFDHDPRGAFLGMDFRPEPARMSAFTAKHQELSTSPESSFRQVLCVQRRDAAGVDNLRGLNLIRLGSEEGTSVLSTRRDYFEALADIFGLTLDEVPPELKAGLWRRLSEAHEKWLATSAAKDPAGTGG